MVYYDKIRMCPPHQIDAEQSLLGGIMNDPSGLEEVTLAGDEFYKDAHCQIFAAIKTVASKGEPPDLVMVSDELTRKNQIEAIGGYSYLAQLTDWVVTSQNARAYARIIKDKSDARRMIQSTNEIQSLAYNSGRTEDLLSLAKSAVKRIEDSRSCSLGDSGCSDMAGGMPDLVREIKKRIDLGGKIPGLPTGYEKLDKMTSGMFPQDMWVLAARPGQGKTALSLNITRRVAGGGVPVLWFSLDMSRMGLWERLISTEAEINLAKIRSGNLIPPEFMSIEKSAGHLRNLPITIIDTPCTELDVIRRSKEISPGLIVVDHLTKIIPSKKTGNANYDYGNISKEMKNLAKTMDIPILLLCQLNRENEKDGRPPRESDLRDSGEIEQDADTIIFIHSKDKSKQERDLIIAKQRQGELAVLKFKLQGWKQLFEPIEVKIY